MIKPLSKRKARPLEIDLTGPDGNVFNLMNIGYELAIKVNERRGGEYIDPKALVVEMMSSDYEHAIQVMEKNFGHMIIMYR